MYQVASDWSAQQLAEFLAAVSSFKDEPAAIRGAVERAAEAFESEVGAALRDGEVLSAVGFPRGQVPEEDLAAIAQDAPSLTVLPGVGTCSVLVADIDGWGIGGIVLARAGEDGFTVHERNLLRAMTRVLALTLEMLERQRLLAELSRIQRSISHRDELSAVLDAITQGAAQLLDVDIVGLRLLDPDDPNQAVIASSSGVPESLVGSIRRTSINDGAGGLAIREDHLVIIEGYDQAPEAIDEFAERNLQTAMAAPVHEDGKIAGSLVVGSYKRGRHFTESEQEALRAFAEHASLALTDAKTVEAMREAQRSKDMFLAMVSHELKTPLTVIMGTLRTLEIHGDDLPPELVKDMLSTGWDRGKELERLIDRLLQGARAERAGAEEQVFLPHLLADAVRGFEHSRRVRLAETPAVVLRLDRPAVLEVLGVLLENAVSHSSDGAQVSIITEVESHELRIEVSNPGALPEGLDPRSLFQPFQRGAAARSPGVGLGLYIAGRVAASLGGTIDLTSQDGHVRLVFRLPVDRVGASVGSKRS